MILKKCIGNMFLVFVLAVCVVLVPWWFPIAFR